jgi:hypothetical protein
MLKANRLKIKIAFTIPQVGMSSWACNTNSRQVSIAVERQKNSLSEATREAKEERL